MSQEHLEAAEESLIAKVRECLAQLSGAALWERLEELSRTEAAWNLIQKQNPTDSAHFLKGVPRRDFLRLMGASLAAAGMGACTRQPDEVIVPFAKSPEYIVPGRPRYFATAMDGNGPAMGLLIESHMGRPTKVEGNPDHPGSLGATDCFAQAAIYSLYDPDRSRSILHAGQISTWDAFLENLGGKMDTHRATQGEGLRILTGSVVSPTLASQLERLRRLLPQARWHQWEPIHRDNVRKGAELAFRADVHTQYRFDKARVVVALDADFLGSGTEAVRSAREFVTARKGREQSESINRLYVVESSSTLTGAYADHRLGMKPTDIEGFARALACEMGMDVDAPRLDQETLRFTRAAAKELSANAGGGLVVAGPWQSPAVHAIAHLINHSLQNFGSTVEHTLPLETSPTEVTASLRELVNDIRAGRVKSLIMLGGNPAFDAPADLDFVGAIKSVTFRVHLSLYVDETSELCHWHIPMTHFLEDWGDTRAYDGTVSIVQPLIAPLYGGKSAHELVSVLSGEPGLSANDIVRAHWRTVRGESMTDGAFEAFWKTSLHDGVIAGSAVSSLEVTPRSDISLGRAPANPDGLEVTFRPDASVYDGRFANNAWLQELPRPVTRLTWDNAILISPATAERAGVDSGDVVELTSGDRSITGPVWKAPGHPDEALTLHLGNGRTKAGGIGSGVGFDAYPLRTTYSPWSVTGVRMRPTRSSHSLATVQKHGDMEGRELVRVASFDRFQKDPHSIVQQHGAHDPAELSMYPDYPYDGYAWGMVIDLNACIGCNACMIACQSENNIPIVGKEEVLRGRELHWIRIDRYYEYEIGRNDPSILHQPIPCMHCENAPCEVVCPVGATVHGEEGLNEMVYNRCVGTRYCSNNCPYKVRRFNFFHYADYETESLKLGNNPDVTVRSRGVMEKCTYCVQRINQSRITAKKEDRKIRDGEVRSACQQVCPTEAIVFGDINDAESEVARLRKEPHHYGLLEELDTRPRTTYLTKLTNSNPELDAG